MSVTDPFNHKGRDFYHTGKTGTDMRTGEKSYEFSHRRKNIDQRMWKTESGKLRTESFLQYVKKYIEEAAGFAATARAGEKEWHTQLTDTAKVTVKKPVQPIGAEAAKAHRDKMFSFHAKMHAAAKTKGDEHGMAYHSSKLNSYK